MSVFLRSSTNILLPPRQLHQYIGATDMVAPLVLLQTYGQNWHNCLHFGYNGAAVFAVPTIAFIDMFTMCVHVQCTLG
jgi:hypothetical protein